MRSQADISLIEKYMKPSGSCQVCLSEQQLPNDFIITCELCRSCIHQSHYGSQLISQSPEVWQCERCRNFHENSVNQIHCEFCPNIRGIMKQYVFENRKIWLHPECAGWGYPIIFFATNKKQVIRKEKPKSSATQFWVKDYQSNPYPCQVCKSQSGFRLKCKYHNCTKSYHVTCGRSQGVVRDLESMKIEGSNGYFPVYCRTHIQLKIEDYKKRGKMLKQKGQNEKGVHFLKVSQLFTVQRNNMLTGIKKFKSQEQMINKMSIQTRRKIEGHGQLNLSDIQNSFGSQQSGDFLRYLQQQIVDDNLPVHPLQNMRSQAGTGIRSLNNGNENEMDVQEKIEECKVDGSQQVGDKMDEQVPKEQQQDEWEQMKQQEKQQQKDEEEELLNEYEKYFDDF